MKKIIALSFIATSTFLKSYGQDHPQVLQSNSKSISYQIENNTPRKWLVSPELKPDRLDINCDSANVRVSFNSDVDSAIFTVNAGDTINFYVMVNNQDSALTQIVGQPKNVNFSDAYVAANQDKFIVEVPEVHELANIAVAISNIGRLDSNMTDMTTPYYKEVMAHFSRFADHPLIDTINHHITKVLENSSYNYYYGLKMSACAYRFDEDGAIVNEGIIRRMGFGATDFIVDLKDLFEDFAEKSDFRTFYQTHKSYYNSLVSTYYELSPLDKMQRWLEEKFARNYGSYRVIFSPLVGGAHATERFEDNGLSQTVMFVRRSTASPVYSKALQEMLSSRIVFTEIDHNFVNPVTDDFAATVDKCFADRKLWVNDDKGGTSLYQNPYKVFNEYMTWAVFSLYCLDQFPKEEFEEYQAILTEQMEQYRGFIRFGDFNKKLVAIYQEDPNADVHTWYRKLFEQLGSN